MRKRIESERRTNSSRGRPIVKQDEWRRRNEEFRNYIKWTYSKGHVIEAMVLLYQGVYAVMYFIFIIAASRMRIILNMTSKGTRNAPKRTPGISDYHFRSLAHMLHEMGVLDGKLHSDIVKLADFRDQMMHRFFSSRLNQSRFGQAYQLGMEVIKRVSEIAEQYPENLDRAIRPITQRPLLSELLAKGGESEQSRTNR